MREIKFRAWDKEKEKLLQWLGQYGEDEPDFNRDESSAGAYTRLWEALCRFEDESDRFVLMQYTGLKDKNGKEIYEGDIIKRNKIMHVPSDKVLNVVTFENGMFMCGITTLDNIVSAFDPEVIGNIHENPDLLKKGEQNESENR